MQENSGFNFLEDSSGVPPGGGFRRQRAVYLAERNARKMQAMKEMRRQRESSSSSDGLPRAMPPTVRIAQVGREVHLQKELREVSNTQSSNSPQEGMVVPQSNFRLQREKYKQERLMRREQAKLDKRNAFGSSSSEEKGPTIRPRAKPPQLIVPPQIKVQRVPFREDDSPFGLQSLEMEKGLSSAREPREVRQPRGLLSSVRLKDKGSDRKTARERYQVEVPSKKGVNVWLQRWLEFRQSSLELADRTIPIYDISKVKLMIDPTPSGSFRMKLTLSKEEEVFLAVNPKRINEVHYLDQYYFIFAKIISLKLQLMGRRPSPISRVREGLKAEILRQARLAGKVRKSSFFGSWQEKIGVVGNQGLALYKAGKDEAGLTVPAGGVKELWTRFQFQRQNLVIKFLNGSSKVELSVPCEDFVCRENWLYQIYSLSNK